MSKVNLINNHEALTGRETRFFLFFGITKSSIIVLTLWKQKFSPVLVCHGDLPANLGRRKNNVNSWPSKNNINNKYARVSYK